MYIWWRTRYCDTDPHYFLATRTKRQRGAPATTEWSDSNYTAVPYSSESHDLLTIEFQGCVTFVIGVVRGGSGSLQHGGGGAAPTGGATTRRRR